MVTKPVSMRRIRSRNMVLNALKINPQGFSSLEKSTGLSPVGLNDIRKILLNEKLIEPAIIDGKKVYKITEKGTISLGFYPYLAYLINAMHLRDGKYHSDYSRTTGSILSLDLSWGIQSDLMYDKEIDALNLLSPKDVLEIEKLLYKKITNNIKKQKLNKEQIGKMVLGFDIDYNEVLKSIKDKSLAYSDNSFEEEWKLRTKRDGDPEGFTAKEHQRLTTLRKKTYDKINKLNL